jgi:hypothetical protein
METTIETPQVQKTEEEVVRKAYPEKGRLVRRIANVFGRSFRVNYHDPEQQNRIVQSHFVVVIDGQAVDQTNRN